MGLTALLFAWFAGLFVTRGFAYPVGPDAPVYLWWTRLAGLEGLSAVERPGVPALALVLQGTLHLPLVGVVAALEVVFGAGVGLAAAALLRAAGQSRATWLLAGVLAGTFAVHLAAGYLSNLVFAALFIAAAATLAEGTNRSAVAAAAMLAASGFAHPLFFLLGALILLAAALLAWQADRGEVRRVGRALAGAAALLGAGELALLAGPAPPAVDTSKDAFLRRAGLDADLRAAYLDRFVHHWARYVEWASLPLALYGLLATVGFVGRFLLAWAVALVAGAVLGLVTGAFPADRFITFGYVVPILAAVGIARMWTGVPRRRIPIRLLAAALTAAMLAGAFLAWSREDTYIGDGEVAAVTVAGRFAAASPPGTPLRFRVDAAGTTATFFATQAANVIRSSLPPDRIRDVFVVVPPYTGSQPLSPADARQRRALVSLYDREAARAISRGGGPGLLFQLQPFDRVAFGRPLDCPELSCAGPEGSMVQVAPGVRIGPDDHPQAVPEPVDPLRSSSPGGVVAAALGALVLLGAGGFGWARAAGLDMPSALALSPLFGSAGFVLIGILLERLGLPLTGWAGPTFVSGLGGLSGYVAWPILQRRIRAEPTP